jgi:DNA-binding phage protein
LIEKERPKDTRYINQLPRTMMTNRYHAELIKALRDPDEAAEYLDAALEEGDPEAFLMALRNVAEAQGDMYKLAEKAEKAKINQDYLKKRFLGQPNLLYDLNSFLHALGFRLAIQKMS